MVWISVCPCAGDTAQYIFFFNLRIILDCEVLSLVIIIIYSGFAVVATVVYAEKFFFYSGDIFYHLHGDIFLII
jgi:hypothetical protein